MRVLLIEDDSATAQSIELMLNSERFNVYTTNLGEEGIDLGKLYDYDIILLDINLPDMSGYEVLRTLRMAKIETPILILSGLGNIEDWTDSIRHLCLRCSYGTPHQQPKEHAADDAGAGEADEDAWDPERNLGIAAQSRRSVDKLLALWTAGGSGRWVEAIEQRDVPLSAPADGQVWWRWGDEEEDDGGGDEKIIAVPTPKLTQRYAHVKTHTDLPQITLQQIQHFFEHYKDLEPGKWVKVLGWGGADEARKLIQDAIARAKK